MGGNGLSQNEIDALLGTVDDDILSSGSGNEMNLSFENVNQNINIGKDKKDIEDINQFINNALLSGIGVIGDLTETNANVFGAKSLFKDSDQVVTSVKGKAVTVGMRTRGILNGELLLIFEEKGILALADKMLGQEGNTLTDIVVNTLGESFSKFFKEIFNWIKKSYNQTVDGDIPKINIYDNPIDIEFSSKQAVEVSFSIRLDNKDINCILAVPATMAKEILNLALKGGKEESSFQNKEKSSSQEKNKQIDARPVQFSRLDESNNKLPLGNIEILLDVSMQVTVELGRTKMRIREILGLGEGSIIELQKLAGEPVDILVNQKLIAKGEVVVIDEYFGVRITEIINTTEMLGLMSPQEEGM
ncbi:MAG TPA: flagellar motor switch protein FliN [Spirochaetia bacterium]|nr:MAG: flagellar motor switch protein FliN [Spirochaetes bacterium GWB1_36_13]HCL57091.1 flagellar motor switch protein FliN [Spirochaetia bacterium]